MVSEGFSLSAGFNLQYTKLSTKYTIVMILITQQKKRCCHIEIQIRHGTGNHKLKWFSLKLTTLILYKRSLKTNLFRFPYYALYAKALTSPGGRVSVGETYR